MTVWSAYAQGSDGNGIRVGIDLTRSGKTITAKYYFQTEFNYNDSQTLNRTGSLTGAHNYTNNQGGGSAVLIVSNTFTGTAGTTHSFGANITGVYNGANPSVTTSIRVPYDAPAAPGTPTIARVSDTQQTVSWARNATTAAPYSSQAVQRRIWNGSWSTWQTVANVSSTATSWSDTTTVAQRIYQYRVAATNESGTATSGSSSNHYTTPAAPTGCAAVKSGSDIVVSWTNGPKSGWAYVVEIYESSGGAAYVLAHTTTSTSTTSWTDVAPNTAVTHQYRVRTKNTSGAALVSGYSTSDVVQLLAPPNAPTNLAPTSVRDLAAAGVALTWKHNPVDTTAQVAFQVRHRALGGPTWTEVAAVTSGTSSWTLPAGTYANGTTVEWQVRTRGQHATFGAYSASGNLPTSSTPTVAVNTPVSGAVVATSSLTADWGYFQAEGSPQVSWSLALLNAAGVAIESRSGTGDTSSLPLTTALADGASYSVRVRVTSAAGLTSAYDTNPFTVDYALPPTPVLTAVWNEAEASTTLAVDVPAPAVGQEPAVTVDVFRSIDGGASWQPVALAVPYDGGGQPVIVTDYAPRVAGSTRYSADTVSALPSRASTLGPLVRTNYVKNPSAEVDVATWQPSSATLTRVEGSLGDTLGGWRFRLTATTDTGTKFASPFSADRAAAAEGEVWTGSALLRADTTTAWHRVTVQFLQADGSTQTGITHGVTAQDTSPTGTRYSITTPPAPALTAQARVIVYALGSEAGALALTGATVDFDDVLLERTAVVGTYFDGSLPDLPGDTETYSWTGPEHNSVSEAHAPVVVTGQDPALRGPLLWLGGGPLFSQVCHSGGNVSITSGGGGLTRVLRQYAGRVHPVEHTGTEVTRTWNVSFDVVVRGDGTSALGSLPSEWDALGLAPGPMRLRVAEGDLYALVSISGLQVQRPAHDAGQAAAYGVSFSLTEVSE